MGVNEMKKKRKDVIYTTFTMEMSALKRFYALREIYQPHWRKTAFMHELLDVYTQAHCPECKRLIEKKTCICKESEKF
jgi:hypothetical protein